MAIYRQWRIYRFVVRCCVLNTFPLCLLSLPERSLSLSLTKFYSLLLFRDSPVMILPLSIVCMATGHAIDANSGTSGTHPKTFIQIVHIHKQIVLSIAANGLLWLSHWEAKWAPIWPFLFPFFDWCCDCSLVNCFSLFFLHLMCVCVFLSGDDR